MNYIDETLWAIAWKHSARRQLERRRPRLSAFALWKATLAEFRAEQASDETTKEQANG